jgi:site-specific recombinase XerD
VRKLKDASGVSFHIHMLRHTFATLMLEGGCDIYSLSRMMGHSDIKTTTIYLSATAEHLRAQMGKHPMGAVSLMRTSLQQLSGHRGLSS